MGEATAMGRRSWVLFGLLLSVFLSAVEATVVATAMPTVISDLGGIAWYGWIAAAYLLAATVTMPVYGRLADLVGRKPVLLVGIVLFLLGSAGSGAAQDIGQLVAARALQGLGAGAIQPVATTVVGDLYTLEERGRIQGLLGAIWGISAAIGPVLGGFLVAALSWRWVFWFNLPFGLGSMALLLWAFHEHGRPVPARVRIDVVGALLLGAAATLLLLGAGGTAPLVTLPLTALFAGLFFLQERRTPEPILPLGLMARRHIAVASVSCILLGAVMMGVITYAPLYVQGVLGQTPTRAGLAVAPMLIGWPIAAAITSRLLPRVGFRWPVLLGSAVMLAGMAVLAEGIQLHGGFLLLWTGSFALGAGLGLCSTTLLLALQSSVSWELRGIVTAVNMFSRNIGGSLGVGAMGAALATLLASRIPAERVRALLELHGRAPAPADAAALESGLSPLFWVLTGLAALNVLVLLLYPRHTERPPAVPAPMGEPVA